MKVFVLYQDTDNSCSDAECCGGPYPYPSVKVFSSLDAAKKAGLTELEIEHLTEVTVDNNEFVGVE